MCSHDGTGCRRTKPQKRYCLVAAQKPGPAKWQLTDQFSMKLLCWPLAMRSGIVSRNTIGWKRFAVTRGLAILTRRPLLRRDLLPGRAKSNVKLESLAKT